MKLISILLINIFLMINSIRNENELLNKAWGSVCKINFCGAALEECIDKDCLGKVNCKACVESYRKTCSICVDEIYDETAQITLPDQRKTIICDLNNQLHVTVCDFYCRSLFKQNYKCEIISNIPVCNCIDIATSTTTAPSTTTTTFLFTTTKKPDHQSNTF